MKKRQRIKCELCNKDFDVQSGSFTKHISEKYSSMKEYYDKYLLKDKNIKCEFCNNEAKFIGLIHGYNDICSDGNCLYKKRIKMSLEKHGVPFPSQLQCVKDKYANTIMEKYGATCYPQSKEGIEKKKMTWEKNGYTHPMQSQLVKDKLKITNNKKYGADTPAGNKKIAQKIKKTKRINLYDSFIDSLNHKNISFLDTEKNYLDGEPDLQFKCNTCGSLFQSSESSLVKCVKCKKIYNSIFEMEIHMFLHDLGVKDININKKYNGKQIDIYLPEYNFGIEYNGLYWHSDKFNEKNQHQDKFLFFNTHDIHIIQILENHWADKKEIIKSLIKNKINKNKKTKLIDCIVQPITNIEYKKFIETHALYEFVEDINPIGWFFNNELLFVSAIRNNTILYSSKIGNDLIFDYDLLFINNDAEFIALDLLFYNINVNNYKITEPRLVKNKRKFKVYDCGQVVFRQSAPGATLNKLKESHIDNTLTKELKNISPKSRARIIEQLNNK